MESVPVPMKARKKPVTALPVPSVTMSGISRKVEMKKAFSKPRQTPMAVAIANGTRIEPVNWMDRRYLTVM